MSGKLLTEIEMDINEENKNNVVKYKSIYR